MGRDFRKPKRNHVLVEVIGKGEGEGEGKVEKRRGTANINASTRIEILIYGF
jgi:hypothetical protein